MTVLDFTGDTATAAAVILAGTSLRHLVSKSGPIQTSDAPDEGGRIYISDDWMWSSGERYLIALLHDLSTGNLVARAYSMEHVKDYCDAETVRVCEAAMGTLEGMKA